MGAAGGFDAYRFEEAFRCASLRVLHVCAMVRDAWICESHSLPYRHWTQFIGSYLHSIHEMRQGNPVYWFLATHGGGHAWVVSSIFRITTHAAAGFLQHLVTYSYRKFMLWRGPMKPCAKRLSNKAHVSYNILRTVFADWFGSGHPFFNVCRHCTNLSRGHLQEMTQSRSSGVFENQDTSKFSPFFLILSFKTVFTGARYSRKHS